MEYLVWSYTQNTGILQFYCLNVMQEIDLTMKQVDKSLCQNDT